MDFSQNEDYNNISLIKFESMLKTNAVLFFDSSEFENIIHHYLENGKISLAKKAIKMGLQQHPTSVNLQLFKIEILVIENKFEEADIILEELHHLEPNNEEIYIQKANVLSKQDFHKKAINALLIALELSTEPDGKSDLYGLIGMEYLFLEEYKNALTFFKKCLLEDNSDYSALHNIIYCFDFLDKTEDAIDFLNTYVDTNPYSEIAWHQLGRQYFSIKEYDKAKAAFDFAIISDDTFVGAYLEKGKVLEKQKKYEEAIENYKITLALEDPTSFALLRIGYCYEKLGNNELAVHFFNRTVEEDPLLDKGWIAITRFYHKQKNYQKALHFIKKAVNIDNDNVLYWKLYAKINLRLNFFEEAEVGFKRALDLGNYEIDTWINRTDVLIKLGEYDAAIYNLLQAIEFYPESAEIEYRLGALYFKLMENNKGHYHLKNALRLNGDYDFIIEELFPNLLKRPLIKEIILSSKKSSE